MRVRKRDIVQTLLFVLLYVIWIIRKGDELYDHGHSGWEVLIMNLLIAFNMLRLFWWFETKHSILGRWKKPKKRNS